jgi:hypothetical protein
LKLNVLTTKGDLMGFSTVPAAISVGTNGYILTADSTQATGVKWAPAPASSPLTTKGDIYVYSTTNDRLPVGANGKALVADSTQATGLNWATVAYYAFGANNFTGTGSITAGQISAGGTLQITPVSSGTAWNLLSDGNALTVSLVSGGNGSQFYLNDTSQTLGWNGRVQFISAGTGTGVAFVVKDSGSTPRFTLLDNGSATFANSVAAGPVTITATGTGTDQPLTVNDSGANVKFVVLGNGKVGIGTIPASANTYLIQMAGNVANGMSVDVANASANSAPQFQFTRSRGTQASRAAVASGDSIFSINGIAYYNATQSKSVATLRAVVDGTIVGSAIPGAMVFLFGLSETCRVTSSRGLVMAEAAPIRFTEDTGSGAAVMGKVTLAGGTANVVTAAVTANSRIMLSGQNSSGTAGNLTVSARNPGSDFTITSSSILDTRDVAWIIFEPT